MADDSADLTETIEDVAAGPASVTGDGHAVVTQKIPDLIAADQYLAGKEAADKPHLGLRIVKLKQPGARGREPGV